MISCGSALPVQLTFHSFGIAPETIAWLGKGIAFVDLKIPAQLSQLPHGNTYPRTMGTSLVMLDAKRKGQAKELDLLASILKRHLLLHH